MIARRNRTNNRISVAMSPSAQSRFASARQSTSSVTRKSKSSCNNSSGNREIRSCLLSPAAEAPRTPAKRLLPPPMLKVPNTWRLLSHDPEIQQEALLGFVLQSWYCTLARWVIEFQSCSGFRGRTGQEGGFGVWPQKAKSGNGNGRRA